MTTKKVFFFTAGATPTVDELALIAAMQEASVRPFELTVMRGDMPAASDYNVGHGPRDCDAVMGTPPDTIPATPVAASKAGTFSAAGTAADTITIGTTVYTLRAAPTTVANEVKIGADAATTAANLVAAINKAAGAGTLYGSLTVAHPSVTAAAVGAVVTVTAKVGGTGGNSIALAEASTGFSWAGGAVALSGGGSDGFYDLKPDFASGSYTGTVTTTMVNGTVTGVVLS